MSTGFPSIYHLPNILYIIHDEDRQPVNLCFNVCGTGEGCAITGTQAYHVQFPSHLLTADHPICHLANAVAAIKTWVTAFQHNLVHIYCDNEMAVMIFQADSGGILSSKCVLGNCDLPVPHTISP